MTMLQGAELQGNEELLEQLKAEYDQLEEIAEATASRLNEIKAQVKRLASDLGGDTERIILPAGDRGAFDRVVSKNGEGTSVAKLEEVLGTEQFRKLCCIKQVVYTPAPELIEASRLKGKITDAILAQAYEPGTPVFSLRKMTPKQFEKYVGAHEGA